MNATPPGGPATPWEAPATPRGRHPPPRAPAHPARVPSIGTRTSGPSALDREGNLIAGGTFSVAGGVISPSLARYRFATPACCPADLDDGSGTGTRDAAVTIDYLLFFVDRYAIGDDAADLDDGSGDGTSDGAVTIDDLLFFVTRFAQGC
ncbi:MAG: GC-type dockerin domain-anchored protein [Phycisphaerales bacterium]